MAQVTITQLPQALTLTGNESVPIVQNGVTVQTTTGAIAVQPTLTQTFLTATQQTSLTNSRYLAVGSGLDTVDGGAQGTLQINMTGAAASLNSVGNGLMVKTDANTLTPRAIDVGTGLGITNANGVDGDPLIALGSFLANFQSMSGSTGLIGVSGGVVSPKSIAGTSGNIAVANGDGSTGDPTINLVSTGVTTGTFGSSSAIPVVTIDTFGRITGVTTAPTIAGGTVTEIDTGTGLTGGPITLSGTISIANTGVTAGTYGSATLIPQFEVNAQGQITDVTEFSVIGGVASVTGTANEITASPTSGDVVVSLPSALTFTGKTVTNGTFNMTAATVGSDTVTTNTATQTLTGKTISGSNNTLSNIANSSLTNSSVTINGSSVSLGGSTTITASTTSALTIGTGLSGTSFDGGSPVTIAIDSTVATLTGTQTLTGKTINGPDNTLTNIANASLANSSITLGTTNIALGGTSLAPVGLTSVTVTQNPTTDLQLATKQYVDTLVSSGITYHTPVKYEVPDSTGNLNATYNNGTAGVGATLTNAGTLVAFTPDGVVASVNDRILIYNQTNQAENGVYVVTTVGSGAVAWVLTRSSDTDTYALKDPNGLGNGDAFFITSGNTGAGETYVCTTEGVITFGTTAITFAQISASQVYSAGTGLSLTGTQFSITNTAVTADSYGSASSVATFTVNAQGQLTLASSTAIAINGNQITSGTVGTSYISGSYTGITGVGTLTAGTWNASTIDALYGGTGITSYAVGDMLYASGAAALSKLTLGTSGYVMTAGASAPQYVAQSTLSVGSATNATNAANTAITADSTNATNYLTFVSATSGNLPQLVNSGITCNPSTGQITGGVAGGAF